MEAKIDGVHDPPTSDAVSTRIGELEARIALLEKENRNLRRQVMNDFSQDAIAKNFEKVDKLSKDQIERYSRQLILEEGFGVEGQRALLSSSVLVVGAGGIGSTVLLYLASSGVGKITIVDFDGVETSNLQRQVIHNACNVGVNKAISARRALLDLNPSIQVDALPVTLSHDNALELVGQHDCVVDASDNPRTRYLINDACVLSRKPLVSGSAVGTEGQLTVYNWKGGACYRCLYPKADASGTCQSCSDAGVLGPVPGLIGVLQSMETLKILTGIGSTQHERMLMYDALQCSFLSIKKPGRSVKCPICGPDASIFSMEDSRIDLLEARGPTLTSGGRIATPLSTPSPVPAVVDVTCSEYKRVRDQQEPHILLDVRVVRQFDMCALDGAVSIPVARIPEELDRIEAMSEGVKPVYCLCRRGIASREAARILLEAIQNGCRVHSVRNIQGGLNAWHDEVDSSFPRY